jgi:hypothetical protein
MPGVLCSSESPCLSGSGRGLMATASLRSRLCKDVALGAGIWDLAWAKGRPRLKPQVHCGEECRRAQLLILC